MKTRQARKIYKAFYSLKPNYWNNYKGFTLCSFFTCKNPRVLRAVGAPDKPCGVGRADANPKLLLNDT